MAVHAGRARTTGRWQRGQAWRPWPASTVGMASPWCRWCHGAVGTSSVPTERWRLHLHGIWAAAACGVPLEAVTPRRKGFAALCCWEAARGAHAGGRQTLSNSGFGMFRNDCNAQGGFGVDPQRHARLAECDNWCDYPVADRPNAVRQYLQAAKADPSLIKARRAGGASPAGACSTGLRVPLAHLAPACRAAPRPALPNKAAQSAALHPPPQPRTCRRPGCT